MTENTDPAVGQEDLTEGDPTDNKLIAKLRKQLTEAKARVKSTDAENESFRETRNKQRVAAIEEAVNGLNYPQTILDTLLAKVQDSDEDEFLAILADLTPVAGDEDPAVDETKAADTAAVTPSSLGQQVAAAASGGSAVDQVMEALANATSVDEVNAIAAEAGLGDI